MTALAVADLPGLIDTLRDEIGDVAGSELDTTVYPNAVKSLRTLHSYLMRATPSQTEPPRVALTAAAAMVRGVPMVTTDALRPRLRVVYRLLRAGSVEAAWAVLGDNATGLVQETLSRPTATGTSRFAPALPLLTRIEADRVYAELPGFRDPRYGAADECYDITDQVRLKTSLDEIIVAGGAIGFGGWAAYDVLTATSIEQVDLVLVGATSSIVRPSRRVRRTDVVGPKGDKLRRAWAGWATELEVADPFLHPGQWQLFIEVNHGGLVRRSPLGRQTSGLARAATATTYAVGSREITWNTSRKVWSLTVR